MQEQRRALPQRLMRLHLVEAPDVLLDFLCEFPRVGDLALVEVLVLERLVEAFDDAVQRRRSTADAMLTRRLVTAHHSGERPITGLPWNLGPCSIFPHACAPPVTVD